MDQRLADAARAAQKKLVALGDDLGGRRVASPEQLRDVELVIAEWIGALTPGERVAALHATVWAWAVATRQIAVSPSLPRAVVDHQLSIATRCDETDTACSVVDGSTEGGGR
jgi:hypothetical protein